MSGDLKRLLIVVNVIWLAIAAAFLSWGMK
jgi:hypothetical protein